MESVLISSLEHWSYCPRQCGLIHLESVWDENVFTVRGTGVHERADESTSRSEKGVRVERALPIWSDRYKLQGRADIVEFHTSVKGGNSPRPLPVEYKSGKKRRERHSAIQLCAQAICLEEMFGCTVSEGAVYYAASQTRERVAMDDSLRGLTLRTIDAVRAMLEDLRLPPAKYDNRCQNCSLIDACLPQMLTKVAVLRDTLLFRPMTEKELS